MARAERTASGRKVEASEELFSRARRLIPGGVNSPVRAYGAVGGIPPFISEGEGPLLWDVDGNEYIDYVMSWGPLIHGHAFAPVLEAIEEAASAGTSFGAPTEREVVLAEMVGEAISSIEMIRFVNSGTEAVMSAIRLARGFTGRDLVIKFGGNYHGHADNLLAEAGSGGLTLGIPSSPGVPRSSTSSTIVLPYNDVPALGQVFEQRGSEVAAVIVEPVAGNMGVVLPALGFLEAIQSLTKASGALFICDEVITGFRVGLGGAQAEFGLQPDLTTLGKIIGGGLPVGAYGGRRDVMECLAPVGPVYQAGTLSGSPLAMAAGIASLRGLHDPVFYERLAETTRELGAALWDLGTQAGLAITVNSVTGMLTVFFTEGPVDSLEAARGSDDQLYGRFFQAMLQRGLYLPPSQFEAWMLSSAHGPEIIDRTLKAATGAFKEVAGAAA